MKSRGQPTIFGPPFEENFAWTVRMPCINVAPMERSAALYLTEVLGVNEVILPVVAESPVAEKAGATVVVPQPLSPEEKAFVDKMLGAIQVHEFQVVLASDFEGPVANPTVLIGVSVTDKDLSLAAPVVALPGLERLMYARDPMEQQAAKREAWHKLQAFQKEVQA